MSSASRSAATALLSSGYRSLYADDSDEEVKTDSSSDLEGMLRLIVHLCILTYIICRHCASQPRWSQREGAHQYCARRSRGNLQRRDRRSVKPLIS
jgi:hypothetical protein